MQRKQLVQPKINTKIQQFITTKQLKTFTPVTKKKQHPNALEATFSLTKNNHTKQCFRKLIQLKCIISQQLPKMPRDYIVKLLFDGKHQCLLAHNGEDGPIIGGVCFRCFEGKEFAEVVFLAVQSQFRDRRIGTQLIDRLKECMQQRQKKLLLTYADNTALGFFRKQGFEAVLETPSCSWNGYIKIYLEGTLMECKIFDKLKYTRFKQILIKQKEILINKIKLTPIFRYSCVPLQRLKQRSIYQYFSLQGVPGVTENRWSSQQELVLQEQAEFSIILQQLYAVQSLRKYSQAYIFRGLTQLPLIDSSIQASLETWSSIERKIINGRYYKNMGEVCNGITEMFHNYLANMQTTAKQANLIIQFQKKSLHILTALLQRLLIIHIQPMIKEKETRPRNLQLSKQKGPKKN